ncbi:indolethylamine N-methyltransferase-like [Lissotriton helveticus]
MALASCDVQQEINNARLFLETFYSDRTVISKQEIFYYPLERLHEVFKPGGIKGNVLISMALGPTFLQVLPACEHFKEIYVATPSETDEAECKNWLQNKPDAFDWIPVIKSLCTLEGDVEKYADLERTLRATIKQCLTFDMTKSNPFHPVVLPAADCVILYGVLEISATDKETCVKNLRKVVACIKDGGHLVIYSALGMSFYKVGQQTVPCFALDEPFLRKALNDVDYEINEVSSMNRTDPSDTRYSDFKKLFVCVARKKGSV